MSYKSVFTSDAWVTFVIEIKTVKRSDMAILCDHCDNWIHIKCNNLDKLDHEMHKSTADI